MNYLRRGLSLATISFIMLQNYRSEIRREPLFQTLFGIRGTYRNVRCCKNNVRKQFDGKNNKKQIEKETAFASCFFFFLNSAKNRSTPTRIECLRSTSVACSFISVSEQWCSSAVPFQQRKDRLCVRS